MTPPRSNPSADVSGAALSPAKAKVVIPAHEIITLRTMPEKNNKPLQQDLEQEDGGASSPERAVGGEEEDDNYMPPSEDEASLGDDEFAVP